MQKGMSQPSAGRRNNPDAESNMVQLLAAWESLRPLDAEHVVEKNIPDAFAQSGLERWLRIRGIDLHAMSLANLQDEYAKIVTTEQALSLVRSRQS